MMGVLYLLTLNMEEVQKACEILDRYSGGASQFFQKIFIEMIPLFIQNSEWLDLLLQLHK